MILNRPIHMDDLCSYSLAFVGFRGDGAFGPWVYPPPCPQGTKWKFVGSSPGGIKALALFRGRTTDVAFPLNSLFFVCWRSQALSWRSLGVHLGQKVWHVTSLGLSWALCGLSWPFIFDLLGV